MAALASAYGFEGVQPKGTQFTPWVDAGVAPAVDNAMGVIVYGVDEGAIRETLRWAASHELPIVTWVAGWKRDAVAREEAADILTRLGRDARAYGTALSLHHHAGAVFESGEDLAALRDMTQPDDVTLTLDTAHAALGGITDIPRLILESRETIDLFHIKDLAGGGFCALGRGELDFAPIFKAIRDIRFDGWLVIDDESGDMAAEAAMAHAESFLQRHL